MIVSNAKLLSKDIATEFAGRGDEVHMYPLTKEVPMGDGYIEIDKIEFFFKLYSQIQS